MVPMRRSAILLLFLAVLLFPKDLIAESHPLGTG
jgi:hypothetical protein